MGETKSLAHVESFDQAAVLKTLNLDPSDPRTQALLLICDRYGLDPLLKHVVLIQGRPYVTRDGYLHIAHSSGAFDGIEIVEEGEDQTHWWARAAVHRKDMGRPFVYRGRHPKSGSNKQYGPEMAVKCAEVMALRRAFNVTGVGAADERWDADTHEQIDPGVAADLAERLNRLGGSARKAFLDRFGKRPQALAADDQEAAEAFATELEEAAEAEQAALSEPDDEAAREAEAQAEGQEQAAEQAAEQPELLPDNGHKATDEARQKMTPKGEGS